MEWKRHTENKHQSIRRRRDTEGSCGVFHRLLRLFWVSRFVVLKAGTATRKQGLGEQWPSFNQRRKAETTHIGHQREVLSILLSKSDTLLALLDSHESLDSSPRDAWFLVRFLIREEPLTVDFSITLDRRIRLGAGAHNPASSGA